MTNIVYDFLVLGASKEGFELVKNLATKNSEYKIAFISKKFREEYQEKFDNVVYIEGAPIYSSYIHGLIGLSLDQTTSYFGKKLIIATGSKPSIKTNLKTDNIYYNLLDFKEKNKNKPLLIFGETEKAANCVLSMAKKFKYVYFCCLGTEPSCSDKTKEKLAACDNVALLPLCSVASCKNDKNNKLQEVKLSTFEVLKCANIIAFTARKPETPKLASNMITLDKNGYIKVNKNGETEILKDILAVGECANTNMSISKLTRFLTEQEG